MPNPLDKIKAQVKKLSAYTLNAPECRVKINQNENPYDMPEEIKTQVLARLSNRPWSRYPAFVPVDLLVTMARFSSWRADGILAGNGSNELIQALLTVTVGPGTKVLISEPTFTLYRLLIEVLGGEVISLPLTSDLQYDTNLIKHTVKEKAIDLVIICSPNNPTGGVIKDKDLIELLADFSGLVILDEAYHEFSEHTVVPLLKQFSNLIVLRTFSKAMAMAGLRVGYLLSHPDLAREIAKAKKLIAERERLFAALSQIPGLQPIPSQANFILTKTSITPSELMAKLQAKDILARDVSRYPMLKDYVRFSVGTEKENNELIETLQEIFTNLPQFSPHL
ncbi:MAG: histidinol-phosphate aminotransferase [bacterium]|nr:MAG: histidinol-phosphate aminotransferase [bacterium]